MARSFSPDMFADITDAAPSWDRAAGVMSFDAELSPEDVTAVRDRMTSRDDVDQAERALLRAARDGGATNLAALLACRELGDPLPAPIYPEES